MDSLQTQITEELQHIIPVVEELTGLPSRWSGVVELVPNADFRGKKRFSCLIQIDAILARQDSRWPTLIHEALHCVSAGYVAADYRQFPGWEEGVVEKVQRLLRPQILTRLTIALDSTLIAESEHGHRYNVYIEALETLRQQIGVDEYLFYKTLLQTPIKDRPAYVFGRGNQLSGIDRLEFIRNYSAASAVLRGLTTIHG